MNDNSKKVNGNGYSWDPFDPDSSKKQYESMINQRRELQDEETHSVMRAIRTSGDLDGLLVEPKNITFATQDHDEKIFIYVRRHWSENIGWFSRNLVYALLPLLLSAIANLFSLGIDFLTSRDYVIILLVYYSLIVTNVFKDFFDWYFDPYIITNKRVVHYEFKPFSRYVVKEALLSNIENVQEKSAGILANVWGYGSLTISTARSDLFDFNRIPNPTKVRDILVDLSNIARKYDGDNN
jgi:hypothetical protein